MPPPLMPRKEAWLWAPVKPAVVPTIVSNSRIFGSWAVAVVAEPAKNALRNNITDRVASENFFIYGLLYLVIRWIMVLHFLIRRHISFWISHRKLSGISGKWKRLQDMVY